MDKINSINLKKETVKVIDGFKTVEIDNEIYTIENLNVSSFRNGDKIFEAKTNDEWHYCAINQMPAWCYYENKSSNGDKFGKLYNAFCLIDKREIAPQGWKLIGKINIKIYIENCSLIHKSAYRNYDGDFSEQNFVSCFFWTFSYNDVSYHEYLREVISRDKIIAHKANDYYIQVRALEPLKLKGIDLRMDIGNKSKFNLGDGYSIRLKKEK